MGYFEISEDGSRAMNREMMHQFLPNDLLPAFVLNFGESAAKAELRLSHQACQNPDFQGLALPR
jgi:hypothetical protein